MISFIKKIFNVPSISKLNNDIVYDGSTNTLYINRPMNIVSNDDVTIIANNIHLKARNNLFLNCDYDKNGLPIIEHIDVNKDVIEHSKDCDDCKK